MVCRKQTGLAVAGGVRYVRLVQPERTEPPLRRRREGAGYMPQHGMIMMYRALVRCYNYTEHGGSFCS